MNVFARFRSAQRLRTQMMFNGLRYVAKGDVVWGLVANVLPSWETVCQQTLAAGWGAARLYPGR